MEATQALKTLTLAQLTELVIKLQADLELIKNPPKTDSVEMTDDMARRVLNGDLKAKSHKEAAAALNLTYGQVYSCRGKYTFKNIHKEMAAVPGYTNTWAK